MRRRCNQVGAVILKRENGEWGWMLNEQEMWGSEKPNQREENNEDSMGQANRESKFG